MGKQGSHPHTGGAGPRGAIAPLDMLDELDRAALLQGFRVRQLREDELLGDPQGDRDSIFIVRSGRIRVFLAFDDKEYTLAFLEPGDIYSTHSRAYVQAVRDCEVLVASTRQVLGRLGELPGAAPAIVRVLGQALGHSMRIIEDLAFRDVEGRLARFLDGMARRRGEPREEGILLHLDLNTEDIARLLGTTRQTVSSLLSRLTREGLLSRSGNGAFIIHQPEQLHERSLRPRVSPG